MKTWHYETAFVFAVLAVVTILTGNKPVEWIGTFAVLFTFGHASIANRMAEKQETMTDPDVECYKWSDRYFLAKEVLWLAYFVLHESYAALAGVFLFILYPFWRKFYRSKLKYNRNIVI